MASGVTHPFTLRHIPYRADGVPYANSSISGSNEELWSPSKSATVLQKEESHVLGAYPWTDGPSLEPLAYLVVRPPLDELWDTSIHAHYTCMGLTWAPDPSTGLFLCLGGKGGCPAVFLSSP